MKRTLLALSVVAVLLLTGVPTSRADTSPELGDATRELVRALANLGVTVSIAVIQELGKAGEQIAREHLEAEPWRGPAIEPDEYVGGFNLKLYPQGKSRSDDHFRAETFYRLDRHGLKELEINASRP
jgi:hypothetical protein